VSAALIQIQGKGEGITPQRDKTYTSAFCATDHFTGGASHRREYTLMTNLLATSIQNDGNWACLACINLTPSQKAEQLILKKKDLVEVKLKPTWGPVYKSQRASYYHASS